MSPGSSTESYPAFARIGLRENPGKNLNQVTCPDRELNLGHLISRPDALTVTPQLTDERCECENDEEEDEAVLPPHNKGDAKLQVKGGTKPPEQKSIEAETSRVKVVSNISLVHRLKHKILLAQYENTESQKDTQRVLKQDIFSPTEVQERAKQQVQKDARDARDMAVQTPDWESQEKRLKDEPSNKTGHIVQNLNKKYSESIKGQKLKDQQTAVVPVTAKHQNASLQKSNTQTTVKKMEHRCGTSCGHHAEARVQPSSSRTSALTRTNRKAYFEEKKTPFASFGWNDSERNIGQKKTYNVSAPENEVWYSLSRAHNIVSNYILYYKKRDMIVFKLAG
ncbi:hypothetical protein ANN_21525 [Periplaneta americana]|uniref:Uncharacterized protein n=1 Tax=Periplaneta americana TaxID=6978 RepID=A0ABQ8SGD6_PERAM|nr:hypothetical protein ANN_21525 [Periplaneta americana]